MRSRRNRSRIATPGVNRTSSRRPLPPDPCLAPAAGDPAWRNARSHLGGRSELPAGIYSTEAIENAAIEFFGALDEECPGVFLMLYWGYRSPWWLLHANTLFDSGIGIEAASPCDLPAPYARGSASGRLVDRLQNTQKPLGRLGKPIFYLDDRFWGPEVEHGNM